MPTTTPPSADRPGARVLDHPDVTAIRLEDVLHALADPMRLRIVRCLAEAQGELSCAGIELPVSKSTCTHHYRVLREHGVITQIYRGTAKMNGLRRADLDALFPGLLERVLEAAELQDARLAG
ncbi:MULTISPECIES: ArsR/SmtB family transcription factor [Streptomyces]|uniref:Helix-turn-helix transcriptional regulator n=2 Tax=Streptomyces rimosus subsp. rimosus TaxID=132474 RepID=L8EWN9_STRR1|nr:MULTISPECIES: helix-turn-helix domain-containing protein [Streptomyces]KOG73424.1 ArsR family transcriptional regulator [Kitasatospora aureofaciens]MYT45663.1 helix-turn-helix domain-containing protein [Streptomyces sp. SID5471]KOT39655.1 ArsR family transcriptional regulator [Streptomyces rimosus subsp. rimosus]KOT39913.1 ArsR family transcriptional regulator [Streptomyces sp. NRRL WC-3701]KOT49832.1 ArsR family transcriptional regulator [Streptomyces rimosus subsp. rimosus]